MPNDCIAVLYLKQIGDDEAALVSLERRNKKPEPLGARHQPASLSGPDRCPFLDQFK